MSMINDVEYYVVYSRISKDYDYKIAGIFVRESDADIFREDISKTGFVESAFINVNNIDIIKQQIYHEKVCELISPVIYAISHKNIRQ